MVYFMCHLLWNTNTQLLVGTAPEEGYLTEIDTKPLHLGMFGPKPTPYTQSLATEAGPVANLTLTVPVGTYGWGISCP